MMFGHGDDLYLVGENQVIYNFSSNVWYGASHDSLRSLIDVRFEDLIHYPEPDGGSLKNLLAKHYGVEAANILVTNGSISAFYLIAQTWPSSKSAILEPTFAEYEDACRLYNHQLLFINNKEKLLQINLNACDFCWICNPNNPDGAYIETEELLCCVESNPQVTFIIDQVYADFCDKTILPVNLVTKYANLIIVRSNSKICNIPGLRIGSVITSKENIQKMNRFLIPWSVNTFALEASRYILEHPSEFIMPKQEWLQEKDWLQRKLSEIEGVEVFPSSTPFFLVRLNGVSEDLKLFLLNKYGILIRDASNFRGLDEHYIRIATQMREANLLLLKGIKAWRTASHI